MDEYSVVIDALQTKLNALEKMQKGCDNLNSSIGGGMGIMDCIRYEQMDELRQAISREKARLQSVNKQERFWKKYRHTEKQTQICTRNNHEPNQTKKMCEALMRLKFEIANGCHPDDAIHLIDCILAEPANLVRLTLSEKLAAIEVAQKKVLPDTLNRHHALEIAEAIMDAMEAKAALDAVRGE